MDRVVHAHWGFELLLVRQVVGLGASGRAAIKLALARGADVVAVDSKPSCLPLEVRLFVIPGDFIHILIVSLFPSIVKLVKRSCTTEESVVGQCVQ